MYCSYGEYLLLGGRMTEEQFAVYGPRAAARIDAMTMGRAERHAEALAKEMPDKLPNPNALTFTGAVNETYDGSAPKSVAIPTVPESLKNPNKLILSGAVTAEYDGSSEVSVEIPAGGGSGSYTLPIASTTQLGGVKPMAKTDEMTQSVGVDEAGGLWTQPCGESGVGGSGDVNWRTIAQMELTEEVNSASFDVDMSNVDEIFVYIYAKKSETSTAQSYFATCINGTRIFESKNIYNNNWEGYGAYYQFAEKEEYYPGMHLSVGVGKSAAGYNGQASMRLYQQDVNVERKVNNVSINLYNKDQSFAVGTKIVVSGRKL